MVKQVAVTSTQSQFKLGWLDDISAGDNWKTVLRDLQIFQEQARALGLNLNSAKCELTIISSNKESILREFEKACPGITDWCQDQCLLGAPVGLNALNIEPEKKEDLARLRPFPPPPTSLFPNEKPFPHSEVYVSPAHITSIQVWPQVAWTDTIYAGHSWKNNKCSNNRWGVGSNHSPGETWWLWVTVSFGYSFVSAYLLINIRPWPYQCPAGTRAWYRVVPRSCDRLESESGSNNPHPLNAIVRNHKQNQLLKDVKMNWSRTQMISI